MTIQFDAARPIYVQLEEVLRKDIVSGRYVPGQKLESIREMSLAMQVNPNTLQKALASLEADGLIHTRRTNGKFVTEDTAVLSAARARLVQEKAAAFVADMKAAGMREEELVMLIHKQYADS